MTSYKPVIVSDNWDRILFAHPTPENLMQKSLIQPSRVRQIPPQFSWVDQRLVRDHYIEHCDAYTLALYLFLVTVADAQGLSYYADPAIQKRLSFTPERLCRARDSLVRLDLIAYAAPLYQVLSLPVRCSVDAADPDYATQLRTLRARMHASSETVS